MVLPYIGIDECYGVPGKGNYEVHVAIASIFYDDYFKHRPDYFSKRNRATYNSEQILSILENRPMCFSIFRRNGYDTEQVKKKIYPLLLEGLLSQIEIDFDRLNLLVDGHLNQGLILHVQKEASVNLSISGIPKGDTRYRIINIADLVAYHISLISQGTNCGIFNEYKIEIQNVFS